MDNLKRWTQRQTSKSQDAAAHYWRLIGELASDKLSEAKSETAFETLEKLLNEVGKTKNDVPLDIQLARDFNAAKDANDVAAKGRAAAAELRSDKAGFEERARQLEEETQQLWQKAEAAGNQANNQTQVADAAAQALAKCKSRLVTAGHPEFGARATEDARASEVARLQRELSNVELGHAHNLAGHTLHSRRDEIARCLAELGHPVDPERLAKPLPGRNPKPSVKASALRPQQ